MEIDVNFSELCRVCAKEGLNRVSIFRAKYERKSIANILSIFLHHKVHENDGRPTNICLDCMPEVLKSFDLLVKAKNSEQFFQRILSSRIDNQHISPIPCHEPLVILETEEFVGSDPLTAFEIKRETEPENLTGFNIKNENDQETLPKEKKGDKTPSKKVLKSEDGKRSERKIESPEISAFECYICHRRNLTRRGVSKHMKFHDVSKPFKCDVCGELVRLQRDLNYHLCQGQEIVCEYCPQVCHSINEIHRHLDIHREKLLFYKCSRCKQSFNMKTFLTLHDIKHDRSEFACDICGKKFDLKKSWMMHTRYVHTDEKCKTLQFFSTSLSIE